MDTLPDTVVNNPAALARQIISHSAACLPLALPLERPVIEFARSSGWDAGSPEHQKLLAALALMDSALCKSASATGTLLFPTPLDSLGLEAPDSLALSIAATARISEAESFNPLGELYTRIIPQPLRRRAGQFWTGELIAEWMVAWLLQSGPRAMLDVGCGAGNFLLKAAHLLKEKEVKAALYGLDLSPFLLNVTRSAFLARYGERSRLTPELFAQDFLGQNLSLEPDAFICNPPYTRHHHIDVDLKERMRGLARTRLRVEVSRQATLACHFLLKLIADMKEGARAAVIVPMETLDARYGIAAKQALSNHTQIAAIIRFAPRLNAFHKVDVGACILLFEKGYRPGNRLCRLTLEELPETADLLACLERTPSRLSFGSLAVESQDRLSESEKWLTVGPARSGPAVFIDGGPVVPLKSIAKVVRGIATGANDFFVLSSEAVDRYGLTGFVVPTVHRNREVQGLILDGEGWRRLSDEGRRVWLLYLNGDEPAQELGGYIEQGEARGYHLRSLVRTRRKWFAMERREVPSIFFTLLTRGNPRFILNRAGVRPVNMFLLIYPDRRIMEGGAEELLWVLLNSKFSISSLHSISRTYGGNTLKVEPREMDNLPVIDPLKIPEKMKRKIQGLVSAYHHHRDTRVLLDQVDEVVESIIRSAAPGLL